MSCLCLATCRAGGGCFSGYPAQQLRQRRVRCAHSHCGGWAGRAKPMSGGHGWAAGNEDGVTSRGIVVEDAAYFDLCGPKLWWEQSPGGFAGLQDPAAPDAALGATELSAFTPRSWGLNVAMCWDGGSAASMPRVVEEGQQLVETAAA